MKGIIEDPRHRWTIEHVTLPYASTRTIGYAHVDSNMLERLRDGVLPALAAGEAVAVPGRPGYRVRSLTSLRGGLSVLLESDTGTELVSIGIGWSDPGACRIWQEITPDVDEPRRPWVADVLSLESLVPLGDEGLAVARWSAVLARSLAWAVLPDESR